MRVRALAVLGLALAAACARDATGPNDTPVAGVYHLTTVNGTRLPMLLSRDSTTRVDVTESVLTLNQDSTWSEVVAFKVVDSGVTSTPTNMTFGIYSAKNGAVALTDSQGFTSHGAVQGSLLTILGSSFTLVYRR